MAKLESSFKNMFIVLTVISLIAAGSLASMYSLTKTPIELAKAKKTQDAIKDVLPAFDKLEEATSADGLLIHKAYASSGEFVGAAVETISEKGFGGTIKVMVGFDKDGNIVNYSVLDQKETPGLGTKMVDWFKTDKGNQSIVGKNPESNNLTVSKDGGEVDAITASTISSRAFLDAIANGYKAYAEANDKQVDMKSGATEAAQEGGDNE